MMLTGPYNATRHLQKPLPQPSYSFSTVPRAMPDLQGSSLQRITDRDHFQEAMAEMLLLCKEAMRRRPGKKPGGSKPLSLEYLADRLDIDDPCFGYLVRTDEMMGRKDPNFKKGMLQGFITVTTFTNWQKTFRWDSNNEAAYEYDSEDFHELPERKRDTDGSLAKGLQNTVRCGDIHCEGIVWPRVAEISLLGGLGCGKSLVNLIIEELENMKPTAQANYDYVVLQATDNSIPFYESMGFVRVGTIMQDETITEDKKEGEDDEDSLVTSKVLSYKVKTGETLTRIAQKFQVDVWDIIFLNQHIFGEAAQPSNKPKLGTMILIPSKEEEQLTAESLPKHEFQYHIAKENETPRSIARKYKVKWEDIVNVNKGRFPELLPSSRLKDGTRIRVSHFDIFESEFQAYAHWSFPDARFEDPEPSYMMVRKLNRRKKKAEFPVKNSLKAKVTSYEPTPLLIPASPTPIATPKIIGPTDNSSSARQATHAPEQILAEHSTAAEKLFELELRELARQDKNVIDLNLEIHGLWNDMPDAVRRIYEEEAGSAEKGMPKSESVEDTSENNNLETPPSIPLIPLPTGDMSVKYSLYNKVVKLKPGACAEENNYKYWYVLTFIPDLKWCHLAPMVQDGVFGSDKPKAKGKPRWKLVDESLGHELDISSSFCIPVRSRSMRKTLDADKEEWDIIDDGTDPTKMPTFTPRMQNDYDLPNKVAIKPSAERVRRNSYPIIGSPGLLATLPGSGLITSVKLVGERLFTSDNPPPKRLGRPRGSKNKPKSPEEIAAKKSFASGKPRNSAVKFNIPASARKAAAIRSTLKKPDRNDYGKKRKSTSENDSEIIYSEAQQIKMMNDSVEESVIETALEPVAYLHVDSSSSSFDTEYSESSNTSDSCKSLTELSASDYESESSQDDSSKESAPKSPARPRRTCCMAIKNESASPARHTRSSTAAKDKQVDNQDKSQQLLRTESENSSEESTSEYDSETSQERQKEMSPTMRKSPIRAIFARRSLRSDTTPVNISETDEPKTITVSKQKPSPHSEKGRDIKGVLLVKPESLLRESAMENIPGSKSISKKRTADREVNDLNDTPGKRSKRQKIATAFFQNEVFL